MTDKEKLDLLDEWVRLEREMSQLYKDWEDINKKCRAVKEKLMDAAVKDMP